MVRSLGLLEAWRSRRRPPTTYRPGVTVLTVNWNSSSFVKVLVDAVRASSPASTEILVVDNGSTDDSRDYFASRDDVRTVLLSRNFGHGVALDIGVGHVDTEYLAVLDVDAFPISSDWLDRAIEDLNAGARIVGAHMHRNFVHPCFLVTRTQMVHEFDLTFRPVGSLATRDSAAPLFLDVAEAMSQRVLIKFGGSGALRFYEVTSRRGPGNAGEVYGDLVYHNQYATQGRHHDLALQIFAEAVDKYHPSLSKSVSDGHDAT